MKVQSVDSAVRGRGFRIITADPRKAKPSARNLAKESFSFEPVANSALPDELLPCVGHQLERNRAAISKQVRPWVVGGCGCHGLGSWKAHGIRLAWFNIGALIIRIGFGVILY